MTDHDVNETVPLALFRTISEQAQANEDALDQLCNGLRALHTERFTPGVAGQTNDTRYCRECSRSWPCPTIRLVDPPVE